MDKISHVIIILFTFIFPLNTLAATCEDYVNSPKTGLTIQKKGDQKRLISTYRAKYKSQEEYFEAFDKALTKARITLISKYKELKKGDYMQYAKGIQTLGTCTTPGKYLKVSVGRRFD